MDVSTEQAILPRGVCQVLTESWRRYLFKGTDYGYTGLKPLRGDRKYLMIEDMVAALLENERGPKLYGSPLNPTKQRRYDEIVEAANQ